MLRALFPVVVVLLLLEGGKISGQFQQSTGQGKPFSIWMEPVTDEFLVIQQEAEAWYEGRDKGRGTGYKQWKRWEYLAERRLTPDGKIAPSDWLNWNAYHEYMAGYNANRDMTVTHGEWDFLAANDYVNGASGYNPGIGRVNCIAFHPADVNTLWAGLPAGGLWYTIDNGANWEPLTDGLPSIGVSGIVVDPSNTSRIYILTGDGDGGNTRSIGVLLSTNGGETWLSTGLSYTIGDNVRGYKLVKHPVNHSTLWAVMSNGLWRTTDGGVTWALMRTGSYRDLEFQPGNPSVIYASTASTFIRSVDDGLNWTVITSGLPATATRVAIGVTPANTGCVYLLYGPGGSAGAGTFRGLYRSLNAGVNFSLMSSIPNILGNSNTGNDDEDQSAYDLSVAVSLTNQAELISGGVNTWRSVNSGVNWTLTSHWSLNSIPPGVGYTHADIHALEINPLNNRLYCGSDGGIFYSDDMGTTWTDISAGLEPTQWYRIAGFEPNISLMIGGTQDNGTNRYDGTTTVTHIWGADGMDCMIDYSNSNVMYFSTQNGGLRKSVNGGATSTPIAPAPGPWVTPYIMDPVTPAILYGGFGNVYRSIDGGSTWTDQGVPGGGALAVGTDNPDRLYAASGSGLRTSGNSGSTWTLVSGGLPGIIITGIAVNPDNSQDVFVTLGNYNAGQKVYMSNNAGASWTNISGTLPNVPVHVIAYEDNNGNPDDALYIGTDIGIFYRNAALGDWVPFSNGLPVVPVFDLEINETFDVITSATYGRGIWRSQTYTACEPFYILSGTGFPGHSYYQASDYISSSQVYGEGVGQEAIYRASDQIFLNQGFQVVRGSKFVTLRGACQGGVPAMSFASPKGIFAGPMPGLLQD